MTPDREAYDPDYVLDALLNGYYPEFDVPFEILGHNPKDSDKRLWVAAHGDSIGWMRYFNHGLNESRDGNRVQEFATKLAITDATMKARGATMIRTRCKAVHVLLALLTICPQTIGRRFSISEEELENMRTSAERYMKLDWGSD